MTLEVVTIETGPVTVVQVVGPRGEPGADGAQGPAGPAPSGTGVVYVIGGVAHATEPGADGQVLGWVGGVPTPVAASGGGGSDPVLFSVGASGGSSTTIVAAGSVVWRVTISVTAPFDGGSPTLSLGRAGAPAVLVDSFDLTNPFATYDMLVSWGADPHPVLATIGGSPTQGAVSILVQQGPVQP